MNELNRILMDAVGRDAVVSVQNPMRLDDFHEPQPDLMVVRPREDYRRGRLPRPTDVILLIEVADTTLSYDRGVKLPLYARAGIPEVWLVNLDGVIVERHTAPDEGAFAAVEHAEGDEILPSTAWPGLALGPELLLG